MLIKRNKGKTIFDIAKETGKMVIFVIFEDKIYVTLGEKNIDGSIEFTIKKRWGNEKINLQIQPEQEFLLHVPKITVSSQPTNARDYILNFDIIKLKPRNPKDISFTLQPYNVEAIILVYPYEAMSPEILKTLGLVKTGTTTSVINGKSVTLDIYSPTIFALDKQTIKRISAKSRISQIDTILTMTKDLLLRSEGLFSSNENKKAEWLSIFKNWKIWILVGLLVVVAVGAIYFSHFITGFTTAIGKAAIGATNTAGTAGKIIKPTFP